MTVGCRTDHRARVLAAVKRGVSDPRAIATWTDMDCGRVRTELRRLEDHGQIRKVGKAWLPLAPALADAWK